MTGTFDLDYPKHEAEFRKAIGGLEGKVLREVLLQIIDPEINVVYLVFDGQTFSVCGRFGSEVLQLVEAEGLFDISGQPNGWYERFEPANQFEGRAVRQARAIGEAWNGHGLELSFEGAVDRTLIIQSIYAGALPTADYVDCLRVGIASYVFATEQRGDA